MRPIPEADVQPLLLGVLKAFSSYCHKNGLQYFAEYGTLLGAVRHQGFIPWDDDVDVVMKRDDFERLASIAKKDPYLDEDHRFRILLPGEHPNIYPFIKIVDETTLVYERNIQKRYAMGVWLDVFCLTYSEDDPAKTKARFDEFARWKNLNKMLVCGNIVDKRFRYIYPLARVAAAVLRTFGLTPEKCVEGMIRASANTPAVSNTICDLSWGVFERNTYPASLFYKAIELQFESTLISAPAEYDELLRFHYGDYMTLPPENQRQRHGFEGYYL